MRTVGWGSCLLLLLAGCQQQPPPDYATKADLKEMEKGFKKDLQIVAAPLEKLVPGYKKGDFKVRLAPGSTVLGADGKEYVLPAESPSPPPAKGGGGPLVKDSKEWEFKEKELALKKRALDLQEKDLELKKQIADDLRKLTTPENLKAFLSSLRAMLAPDGPELKGRYDPKRNEPPAIARKVLRRYMEQTQRDREFLELRVEEISKPKFYWLEPHYAFQQELRFWTKLLKNQEKDLEKLLTNVEADYKRHPTSTSSVRMRPRWTTELPSRGTYAVYKEVGGKTFWWHVVTEI